MYFYQLTDSFLATTIVEKSRFIAHLFLVSNEYEAKSQLDLIRRDHPKANHNCYAYIVLDNDNNLVMNQSDDGEPSKTAGMPILEQLKHANMVNTLAVVTRYFGGTLLGTGGLIRAYSSAVKDALAQVELKPVELLNGYKITIAYAYAKSLEYTLNKSNAKIIHIDYHTSVTFEVYTNNIELLNTLVSIDRESISIEKISKRWI